MNNNYIKAFSGMLNSISNAGLQEDPETTKRLEKLEQIRERLLDGDKNDPMRADFSVQTMEAITKQVFI